MASEKGSAPTAPPPQVHPPQGGFPEAPPSYEQSMGAAGNFTLLFKRIKIHIMSIYRLVPL